MKAYMQFCTYLEHNWLNMYQSKKYFEQHVYRRMKHTFHVQHTFSSSPAFFQIKLNKSDAMHVFWISRFKNHHGLPTVHESWIIQVFQLFVHFLPFSSMDNQEYTVLFYILHEINLLNLHIIFKSITLQH
jgi:hypothetical protein